MDNEKNDILDKNDIKALSAESRQEILRLLEQRPYTSSEISRKIGKHVTTIKEHLNILESSGLVQKKPSANKWIYYELSNKGNRLTKTSNSWIIALSISILALVGGIYDAIQSTVRTSNMLESSALSGKTVLAAEPVLSPITIILIATAGAGLAMTVWLWKKRERI